MRLGHTCKAKCAQGESEASDSNKENPGPDSKGSDLSWSDSYFGILSNAHHSAKHHHEEGLAELTTLLKQSIDAQAHFSIQASEFQNALIAEHCRANKEAQLGHEEAKAMREEMRQFREASADFASGDSETRFTLIPSHSPGHNYTSSCPPKKHYLIFD